jgi:hypothetical protein
VLEERCVGSKLGHRSSFLKKFLLALIHPSSVRLLRSFKFYATLYFDADAQKLV